MVSLTLGRPVPVQIGGASPQNWVSGRRQADICTFDTHIGLSQILQSQTVPEVDSIVLGGSIRAGRFLRLGNEPDNPEYQPGESSQHTPYTPGPHYVSAFDFRMQQHTRTCQKQKAPRLARVLPLAALRKGVP